VAHSKANLGFRRRTNVRLGGAVSEISASAALTHAISKKSRPVVSRAAKSVGGNTTRARVAQVNTTILQ
jgi:hypothetical protein